MNVMESFSLKGKVAVCTGGAGLYGRQIVEALAEAGATTITASRSVDKLQVVADELNKRGHRVFADKLDLEDMTSISEFVKRTIDTHGRIDILVNNAVLRPFNTPGQTNIDAFARSMTVNAVGLYAITEAVTNDMKKYRSGNVINIGSIQGMVGVDNTLYKGLAISGLYPDYFFHKGGMLNYTRWLAGALGEYNIRVNIVSPGGFFNNQPPQFVERYSDRTVLGRMANDNDLKGSIVFLASDASAYITGANLPIDGGYTAK
jgi:NAD(P)-dependent dehydrogenase (short-subunit alcohol dehydrogenase family)